jgi:hypothetical protein
MLLPTALTTAERLAGYMEITTPTGASLTVMESIINTVSKYIEKYTGRKFKKTTYTQELYSPESSPYLNLKAFPVLSSESFILERRTSGMNENSWDTVDGEFFVVDYEAGIIELMGGSQFSNFSNGFRVTYTAGYDYDNVSTFLGDTEGADIELATWMIASDIVKSKKTNSNIRSERIGDYSISFGDTAKSVFNNPTLWLF